MSIIKSLFGVLMMATLVACGGGGGNGSAPTSTSTTTTATASIASILLTAPSASISADGTSSLTITARALDASNGLVKGAVINLATNGSSILSYSSVTTDATTGLATVTLVADSNNQATRTATVTASCAACSASAASFPVVINGATVDLVSPSGYSLITQGNALALSATVRDAKNNVVPGVQVTFAASDSTVIGLSNLTASTDPSGIATTNITGLKVGSASVTASALGYATSKLFTVSAGSGSPSVLKILSSSLGDLIKIGDSTTITVSAPNAASVNFVSTLGVFASPAGAGGTFTANFSSAQAGNATVTVYDNLGRTDDHVLTVSQPPCKANKIILGADQTTVGISSIGSVPFATLTARAVYWDGTRDQGVANVPILFTMSGGPGGGEYLNRAYQLSDTSGYASAKFYSGSASSIPNGIKVDASIPSDATCSPTRPIYGTGTSNTNGASSNTALLTIGGQSLSVSFGAASVLRESTDKTLYIQDYSVQVTDPNNNPVSGAIVTLRLKPVAFSTGLACVPTGTFCSEDANDNDSLDPGEDGVRLAVTDDTKIGQTCSAAMPPATASKIDGLLTPQNSWGGSVPSTVKTDSTGTAPFSLTYLKGSAIWVLNRLTATVLVNGTEATTSTMFRLRAIDADVTPVCHLPDSPFQ